MKFSQIYQRTDKLYFETNNYFWEFHSQPDKFLNFNGKLLEEIGYSESQVQRNKKPCLRKTPIFQFIHSPKSLMVYSHRAELGPRREPGPELEQWGTIGLGRCPSSGVM